MLPSDKAARDLRARVCRRRLPGQAVAHPRQTLDADSVPEGFEREEGRARVAAAIDKAIHDVLTSGQIKSLAAGRMGMGTREVGDLIAKMVS